MAATQDVTYVKTLDDGRVVEATGSTPADHVRFTFDGWRRKDGKASATTAAEPSGKTGGETKSGK